MKTLFFVLQTFLLVFFLGCQENFVTDPGTIDDNASIVQGSQNAEGFISKDLINSYPSSFMVNDIIYDPTHPINVSETIKGIIRYNQEVIPVFSTSISNKVRVSIRLYVDMVLDANCQHEHKCMRINGYAAQTMDIYSKNVPSQTFNKVFSVSNSCCGEMSLVLTFRVNKDNMRLVGMKLTETDSPKKDSSSL